MWKYADSSGRDAADWAMKMAQKYETVVGVGYVEQKDGEYYNAYLLAGAQGVYGMVRKREGESYLFKGGDFPSIIPTPFGNVAVAICYDSRRKGFYENIKEEEVSLILFSHGSPADPKIVEKEKEINFQICNTYLEAFGVPVVYVNSTGAMDPMMGITGKLMEKAGFRLNGLTKIYFERGEKLEPDFPEAQGIRTKLTSKSRKKPIRFHGEDLIRGNWLFRHTILRKDRRDGMRFYEAYKQEL